LNIINYNRLNHWENVFFPIVDENPLPNADILCTTTEHIAVQLAKILNDFPDQQALVTGGGAFNKFLINRVNAYSSATLVIPDPLIVNYKEALVFALLGVLRFRGEANCLADVTGARENVSGGCIYLPPPSYK
jgi:anhydro-N-acetylmuramic acid kinase